MVGFHEAMRLARLQERLRTATFHALAKDGPGKSSEGAVNLSFCLPPVVGDDRDPYWAVEAWSYMLCPDGRQETWIGTTAAEAISKAEDAIEQWCFAAEMEMFERGADPIPQPEGEG